MQRARGGSGGCRSSRLYSEVATLPVIREEDQIELRSIGDLSRFESVVGKAIIRLSCEGLLTFVDLLGRGSSMNLEFIFFSSSTRDEQSNFLTAPFLS